MKIGFVSTRIAGTDGVSLEISKLVTILQRLGHTCCYCAGELDEHFAPCVLVPEMHFAHPEALWIQEHCFGTTELVAGLLERVAAMARRLQEALARFVAEHRVEVLFVQNALAIPMHVPLGVALTDFIADTGIPTLAHHHDLAWERERFTLNCIPEILARCFPPTLPTVRHLVINSLAQQALWERRGVSATLLPNIFDYAVAAPGLNAFNHDLRARLGLEEEQLLIMQPTRVIPRKGIELAIELVRRLYEPHARAQLRGKEPVLVISHHAGDEGLAYLEQLQTLAMQAGVPLLYAAEHFGAWRGMNAGRQRYALWDAYVHADFVTYPSLLEGFGNALLETFYFRLPVLVNRYPVYVADLAPKGFDVVEIDAADPRDVAAITADVVEAVIIALMDPVRRRAVVEWNYEQARRHYSYEAVMPLLARLLEDIRL